MTPHPPAVTLITTCKGRLAHLQQTLPRFLAQGPECEVVVVDYDCPDGTAAWVGMHHPQVRVVRVRDAAIFNLGKARNRGAGVATGRWLAFVDADVLAPAGFFTWLAGEAREGHFYRLRSTAPELVGTVLCAKADFLSVGGYDEAMQGWGGEDRDLYDRLTLTLRLKRVDVADDQFGTIEHSDADRVRFAELSDKALSQCINTVYRQAKFDVMRMTASNHLPLPLRERLRAHVSRVVLAAAEQGLPAAVVDVDASAATAISLPEHISLSRKLRYEVGLPARTSATPLRQATSAPTAAGTTSAPAGLLAGSGLRFLRRVALTAGPAVFSMVRNETYLLPHFLAHYRALGVENFVFYDDGSTDGTVDLLAQEPDCTIMASDRAFREPMADGRSFQLHAKTAIPDSMGASRWMLVVDADEFLQLPPGYASLRPLYADLERWGYRCVLASMVDFYPERLADRNQPREQSPFVTSPYFDIERPFLRSARNPRPVKREKGVRARLFAMLQERDPAACARLTAEFGYEITTLWKVPLIRTRSGVTLESVHNVSVQPPMDVELALAHFKFGPDLDARIAGALLSRNYWGASMEYEFLKAAIDTLSTESLIFPGSARYEGPGSLHAAGLCFAIRES